MIRTVLMLCLLSLAACTSCPVVVPAEKVVTQTVNVPVPVARQPPPELLACFGSITRVTPPPTLQDAPGGLLVPLAEIGKLTANVGSSAQALADAGLCDAGWKAWATAP
jgi:hypothetical protein